ncbi:hypothetical protein SDC9_96289 [bioreactor metagenome]|uniref:Uncharacterized protein n=1 Tax=bioreactor metagenome TaxID=1076179 RepID=A0A645A8P9_9ZZZZ
MIGVRAGGGLILHHIFRPAAAHGAEAGAIPAFEIGQNALDHRDAQGGLGTVAILGAHLDLLAAHRIKRRGQRTVKHK